MDIIIALLFLLMGVSVGSFLNVVADRVPSGKSIIAPPSHCFNCGHNLDWKDNIPVVSYLILKGKCHYCGSTIGLRSIIIEVATGILFVLAWLRFGMGLYLAIVIIYVALFMILIITGLENKNMPSAFVYSTIVAALTLSITHPLTMMKPDLLLASAGFISGFGLSALAWLLFKKAGRKLNSINLWITGLAGASIGFPAIIICIAAVSIAWLVFLVVIRITGKAAQSRFPYSAVICCIALIMLMTGINAIHQILIN